MCAAIFIGLSAAICVYSAADLLRQQQLITQWAPGAALQTHSEGELITITQNKVRIS